MRLNPSLPLVEVRYFIPWAPLICCSRGVVTEVSTACALAPRKTLDTTTWGGARFGNWAIGRLGIATDPASVMSSAHTVAKMGRRMKKSTNMAG
jgi:hypothetical protein